MGNIFLFSLLAFVASAISGFVLIPMIMNFCKRKKLYDIPNERKVHHNAIPRLGGISFMPSMMLAFILALLVMGRMTGRETIHVSLWWICFLVSLMMIYAVGIIDDLVGLTAGTKFFVQIVAAALLPISGLYINHLYNFLGFADLPFWAGAALTIFMIVYIDNAINLIDGIDGLAAGLSFLALGGFLACFVHYNLITFCVLISGLMGVLVPYLYFNICGNPEKNTKIFMGDSGSLTLGFILSTLFVKLAMSPPHSSYIRREGLTLAITMLVVPMFDVARVVIVRYLHHRPLFAADKNHIHHKLLRMGLSQHQTLFAILLTAIFFGILNIILVFVFDQSLTTVLILDTVLYIAFNYIIDFFIRRKGRKAFE